MKSKTTSLAVLVLLAFSSFFAAIPLAIPAFASFSVGTPTLASPAIDADQSVVVHDTLPSSGGNPPYQWSWLVSFNGGAYNPDSSGADFCGANASGTGASGQDVSCTMSQTFPVLIPFGTYNFELSVTDSSIVTVVSSPSATLTVNSPISFAFTQTTNGVSTPYISSGQDNVITFTSAGGTSPYTYAWTTPSLTVASGCTSADDTCSVTNPATGTYYVTFSATDGAGETFSPPSIPVVNPPLSAGAPTPGSVTIDSGQTATLTSQPSGGSGSYLYQWFTVTTTVCAEDSPIGGAASATYGASPTSTTEYYYVLGDPVTMFTVCSSAATVTVNTALTAGAPTPSPTSVSSGGSVTLSAHASGGTGTLSYQWYSGTSATCSSDVAAVGATSGTYTTTVTANTYFCYSVTDQASAPVTLSSATTQVTISAPPPPPTKPTVIVTPSSLNIPQGSPVTLTAFAENDGDTYTFVWSFDGISGATCSYFSVQSTCTFTPPAGTYQVSVTATGSNGQSGTAVASLTVQIAYQVTLTGSSADAVVGEPFTLSATVAGAPTDLIYSWVLSSGVGLLGTCGQSSSTCTVTSPSVGSFGITLQVYDVNGVGSQTITVTVVDKLKAAIDVKGTTTASGAYTTGTSTGFTAAAAGGATPYTYLWDITANGASVPGCSTASCPITFAQAGTALVKLTVTDASGQTATALQLVTVVAPPPTITLTASPSCLSPGSSVTFTATVKTNTSAIPAKGGCFLASSDGVVCAYGSANSQGSFSGSATFVGMASTPDGKGYWLLSSNGEVSAFGSASYLGSPGASPSGMPWVGIAASPDGKGYWVTSSAGDISAFGAAYYGSVGFPSPPGLGLHIFNFVGMAANPAGGYWLVQSTGGVFAFHTAFHGSLPGKGVHTSDVVGIASTPDGGGYWILGSDGTVYGFGDAGYYGGATSGSFVGMAPTPDGKGYWLLSSGGTVLNFGDAGKIGDGASLGRNWMGISAVSGKATKATAGATALPVVGAKVNFDVLSGPDAGKTFTATTNASGMATFTFSGGSTSGVDTVTATTTGVGSGTLVLAKSSVTFIGPAVPTGPDTILVSGKVQSAVVGKNATVGVRVFTSGGANAPRVPVTFLVTSGPDKGDTVTSTTDGYGVALFTFKGTGAGNDNVSVTAQATGTPSATMQLEWAAPLSFSLGLNSVSTTSTTGSITAWKSIKQDVKLALGLSCQGPSGSCSSSAIFRQGALSVDYPLQAGAPTSAIFYFTPLNAPEAGTSPSQLPGTLLYFDIYLSPATPLPSGTTVQICLTAQSFTSSSQLQYWNGSAWVSPSPSSTSGDTVCGAILTSMLTGTPFVLNVPSTSASTVTSSASQGLDTSYLAIPFGILLVGALLVALSARRLQK